MLEKMYSFIKCSLFISFIYIDVCSLKVHAGKRLLLSDPDVVQNRLKQLELAMQTMKSEVTSLKAESQQKTLRIAQLETKLKSNSGVKGPVYTRWGRKDCPGNGTELIYSGIAGGSWYDNPGSAVDYLCLPHDPAFITNDIHRASSYIDYLYGAEYQDNYFGNKMSGNDVPCAVCRANQASASLMIPGKLTCPGNWKVEYNGRLAGGGHTYTASSQYVCVDMNVQAFEKGAVDYNGKLFVGVQAKCGSLSCPPYTDGAMVTCVVCSE